jgi:hypothetical protein
MYIMMLKAPPKIKHVPTPKFHEIPKFVPAQHQLVSLLPYLDPSSPLPTKVT